MRFDIQKIMTRVSLALVGLMVIQCFIPVTGGPQFGGVPAFAATSQTDFSVKVHEYKPLAADTANATALETSPDYKNLLRNAGYTDIGSSPYEGDIAKLAALGILPKNGSSKFNPNSSMTGYDALRLLINVAGRGAAIEAAAAQATGGQSADTQKRLINDALLNDAQANGIVLPEEELSLTKNITKEQFATFLGRSQGIAATAGDLTNIKGLADGTSVAKNLQAQVDAVLAAKVMNPDSKNKFNPKAAVTFGMGAQALANFVDGNLAGQGTTTDFGVVIGKSSKNNNQFGSLVTEGDILLKKLDGTFVTLKLSSDSKKQAKNDLVVYKKGAIGGSSLLAPGDEVQYFSKNNVVQYAEVLSSQTILNKLNEAALANKLSPDYVFNFGSVIAKATEQNQTRIRLRHYDGEIVDIVIPKTDKAPYSDLLIQKAGKVGGLEAVKVGDKIEYLTKGDKDVVYAALKNFNVMQLKGTIRSILPKTETSEPKVIITDYKNQVKEYPLATFARIFYGTVPSNTNDMRPGQDVDVYVANGYIIKGQIVDAAENPGYITPGSRMRMGIVDALYTDGIGVTLTTGAHKNFQFDGGTVIKRNGNMIRLKDIREGDKVKLSFDTIANDIPSLVELEGTTRLIKQVYKGELFDIDTTSGNLVLNNTSYLKNITWTADSGYKKDVAYDGDTKFYLGQMPITPEDLYRKYKGSTMYLAVEDSFGGEKAVQVAVKGGSEMNFYEKVIKLDQTLRQMELKNKVNLGFGDGTIVIKDGRLIPRNNIMLGDNAMVISSASSSGQQAQVVAVHGGTKDYFQRLHFGSIETVGPNTFTLKYYSRAYDNRFSTVTELPVSREFRLSNESVITLLNADKTETTLTYNDLFHGRYGYTETIDNTSTKGLIHKRYYVYLIEDENGQVLAMNLRRKGPFLNLPIDDLVNKESLITEKMNDVAKGFLFTRGIYTEKDTTWKRLKLTSSHDWSDVKQQWIANSVDTYSTYNNAIIIKNGKVISEDDLQAGDYLFIWRSVEEGLIIFVDNN